MGNITDTELDGKLKGALWALSVEHGVDMRKHVEGTDVDFGTLWADIVSKFPTERLRECLVNPVFKEESWVVQRMAEAIQAEMEKRAATPKEVNGLV